MPSRHVARAFAGATEGFPNAAFGVFGATYLPAHMTTGASGGRISALSTGGDGGTAVRWTSRAMTAVVAVAALALGGAGVADAATGEQGDAGQCERPVGARVGNWYCPEPAPMVVGAVRGFA